MTDDIDPLAITAITLNSRSGLETTSGYVFRDEHVKKSPKELLPEFYEWRKTDEGLSKAKEYMNTRQLFIAWLTNCHGYRSIRVDEVVVYASKPV